MNDFHISFNPISATNICPITQDAKVPLATVEWWGIPIRWSVVATSRAVLSRHRRPSSSLRHGCLGKPPVCKKGPTWTYVDITLNLAYKVSSTINATQ